MKKLLVMATLAIMGSVVANAQIGESKSKRIETTNTTTVNVDKVPFKGYKGMVDFAYGVGVNNLYNGSRISISTTHGYQINPYIFVGAGLQLNYHYDDSDLAVPIFANARASLPLSRNVALYFDYRIGCSIGLGSGFYTSPAIGIRAGRKSAFNFSIGYEYQGCDVYYYIYNYSFYGRGNAGAITFRLGMDF